MKRAILVTGFFLMLSASMVSAAPVIKTITLKGSINPASAKFIINSIEEAEEQDAEALIIFLNTPGGLVTATRDIVAAMLEADVPVVVYVAPGGAQAASAGVFITMAGHIAAMAPGTNIGAAHPVTQGGENSSDSTDIMMTKATNDIAAFARTIAERRGRNIEWAEEAVRRSVSLTETEAVEINVVDIIAANIDDLLSAIDSMSVEVRSGYRVLDVSGAELEEIEMSFQLELLNTLSDPNIAYILMMIGIYGIFFELYNPGAIFPGVVGGICLILGLYSLNALAMNYAGLALILFGVVLFILEIKIVSHGLLSIGGVAALFFGSLMLIDSPAGFEVMEISLTVIIAVTVVSTAFFLLIILKGISSMRRKPTTGNEGIVGEIGKVVQPISPEGKVLIHGEYWKAVTISDEIEAGARVRVVSVRNLVLTVEQVEE
ncbi:MAG: serine protease [Ectothiorhodospiraceae bacterium]|nr:serine protease [Ectothiorhodospiraceae bacterium]